MNPIPKFLKAIALVTLLFGVSGFTACEPGEQRLAFDVFINQAQHRDARVMTCGEIFDSLPDLATGEPGIPPSQTYLSCAACSESVFGNDTGACPCDCVGPGLGSIEDPPLTPGAP